MVDIALIGDCHVAARYGADVKELHAAAKRLGIDHDKTRREVQAAFAAKAAKKKPTAKTK